jgi:GNAT superfamily N-acetyltransferase
VTRSDPSTPQLKVVKTNGLPEGFDRLRAEAADEGFNNIETLWRKWQDSTNRFMRPGEMLVVATTDDELVGIGGITQDFVDAAWLRMRRFYVRPAYRRRGVGRATARAVLDHALPLDRQIALYAAGSQAAAFWPQLGFVQIERENTSHVFQGHQR